MGCLPLLLLFPLGAGAGFLLADAAGVLWGAGSGCMLGVVAMGMFVRMLRGLR
jgi:hypothetical protein